MTTPRPIVFRPLPQRWTLDINKPGCVLASAPVVVPAPLAALASRASLPPILRNLPRIDTSSLAARTPTLVNMPAAADGADHQVITESLSDDRFELALLEAEAAFDDSQATTISVFPAEILLAAQAELPRESTQLAAIGVAPPRRSSRASSFALGALLASVALLLDALLLASSGFGALIQLVVAGGVGLIFAGTMLLRNVHQARRRQEGRRGYRWEVEVLRFCRP